MSSEDMKKAKDFIDNARGNKYHKVYMFGEQA